MTPNIHNLILKFNQTEKSHCTFPSGTLNINLRKLEKNIQKIRTFAGTHKSKLPQFLLPVKANAYGHGMLPVASFVETQNLCDYLGVAHTGEALALRQNNIRMPILIMGQSPNQENILESIVENNLEQAISEETILHSLDSIAAKKGKKAFIHLLVDTGMGRCGILFQNVKKLITQIQNCPNITLKGVMTHFAVADSLDQSHLDYTARQIQKFKQVRKLITKVFPKQKILFHTSNSGGCLENRDSVFDMIRPGIACYGYPENDFNLKLEPVLELTTQVTLVKTFPKNHSIGYGRTYQTQTNNEHIAIIPLGYGDGLSRLLSNQIQVIIHNTKYRSAGRISMDQFAVKVDQNVKIGDQVKIIGQTQNTQTTASDLARQTQTISYEPLCTLGSSPRLRHEYLYNV